MPGTFETIASGKLTRGTDFHDTITQQVQLPDADEPEELTFGYRLLSAPEQDRVEDGLPMDRLMELADEDSDLTAEEEQRLEELQTKAETEGLTDEEEREAEKLARRDPMTQFLQELDKEGKDALRWGAKQAILPDPEDVTEMYRKSGTEKVETLGTREAVEASKDELREIMTDILVDQLERSPSRILLPIGITAYFESRSVEGNGT